MKNTISLSDELKKLDEFWVSFYPHSTNEICGLYGIKGNKVYYLSIFFSRKPLDPKLLDSCVSIYKKSEFPLIGAKKITLDDLLLYIIRGLL